MEDMKIEINLNARVEEITFAFSRSCYQKKRNMVLETDNDENNRSGATRVMYRVSRCRHHIATKREAGNS